MSTKNLIHRWGIVNSSDMVKESDLFRIVKEDILRILGERKEKVSLKYIKAEIKVSNSFISRAIESLEEEDLIYIEKEFIRLTKNGQEKGKDIAQKHLILENFF